MSNLLFFFGIDRTSGSPLFSDVSTSWFEILDWEDVVVKAGVGSVGLLTDIQERCQLRQWWVSSRSSPFLPLIALAKYLGRFGYRMLQVTHGRANGVGIRKALLCVLDVDKRLEDTMLEPRPAGVPLDVDRCKLQLWRCQ